MKPSAWRNAAIATLVIAVMAAALSGLAAGRFAWGVPEIPKAQGEAIDIASVSSSERGTQALSYKPRTAAAIIREPQNTWSNLAFVFAGALILTRDRRVFARFFGAAMIAVGLASGIYHASLLASWRTVDVAMMGWATFALGCFGCFSVRHSLPGRAARMEIEPADQIGIGSLGGVLAMSAAVFRNDVRISGVKVFDSTYMTVTGVTFVFLLLMVAMVRVAKTRRIAHSLAPRLALLALITAAGVFCQIGDHPGRNLYQPDGAVQAHALWHGLMAGAAILAYDLFAIIGVQPTVGPSVT